MTYVKQLCDGYNKQSLLGNWYQQRLYPYQPFREQQKKQARLKDQGITCLDNTGLQRALPRIQRRNKWETTGRIILDDGYHQHKSQCKSKFQYGGHLTQTKEMRRPFDKSLQTIQVTDTYPHSQVHLNQRQYKLLNHSTIQNANRSISTIQNNNLPRHPDYQKQTYFQTTYNNSYIHNHPKKQKINQTIDQAGNYNQNPQENVKSISTLVGQNKKEKGDQKEVTGVQRSWISSKDQGLIQSTGKTVKDFKSKNIPKNDIQTSLNVNVGLHNLQQKKPENGHFRHKRTQITILPIRILSSK